MGKITYSSLSNMKSIITDNTKNCYHCGRIAEHCHHVFEGPDKRWSEEFKLMIPMCHMCHTELHNNQQMNIHYKIIAQEAFMKHYPDKNWMDFFRRNYL